MRPNVESTNAVLSQVPDCVTSSAPASTFTLGGCGVALFIHSSRDEMTFTTLWSTDPFQTSFAGMVKRF